MIKVDQLIIELEENKEDFDDHTEEYITSVCNYYHKNGSITPEQEKYMRFYYQKLQSMFGLDQ